MAIPDEVSYEPSNRPPLLNSIGAKSVDENSLLTLTITASDPDGDDLTYAASNVPTGASLNATSQTFTWTPDYGSAGNYPVTFTVTDNGSPVQSDSEQVTISVGDVNRPPVLSAIGDRTTDEGSGLIFAVIASDPDGDALTLTASNLPIGATFSDNGDGTGIFSWTPDYTQAGTYPNVTFTAADDGTPNLSDSEAITITVSAGDQAPAPPMNFRRL